MLPLVINPSIFRMKFTVQQIADLLDAEIQGDPSAEVDKLSKIEEGTAGSLTFLANPKYESHLYTTEATAAIVSHSFQPTESQHPILIRVADPYLAFSMLLKQVDAMTQPAVMGVSQDAYIDPSATVGQDVYIGPFAYIGPGAVVGDHCKIFPFAYVGHQVKVGKHTTLHARATVYHRCEIGNHCIIHAGAIIGSDGFGFAPQADGSFVKIPQTGNVVIEDEVEVGANATLDRATMGSTLIRAGAKIDNLVQIAHNVEIGPHCAVAAQAGIAGSTKLGAYSQLGGQVGIVGHLTIAPHTKIDAQSGVNRSIKQEGQAFRGSPIQPFRQQLKSEVLFRKLEEMQRRIHVLEQALQQKG